MKSRESFPGNLDDFHCYSSYRELLSYLQKIEWKHILEYTFVMPKVAAIGSLAPMYPIWEFLTEADFTTDVVLFDFPSDFKPFMF